MRVPAQRYSNLKKKILVAEGGISHTPKSGKDSKAARNVMVGIMALIGVAHVGPMVKDYFTQGKITPVRATEGHVGDTPFPAGLVNKGDILVIAERGGDKSFFPCLPNKDHKTCTAQAVGVNVTEPRRDLIVDTNTLKVVSYKPNI